MANEANTVHRCKDCGRTIRRREDLRAHLLWHKINDPDLEKYFTVTEEEPESPAQAAEAPKEAPPKRGLFGWLRGGK